MNKINIFPGLSLYLKAHFLNSSSSAVKLAERTKSEKHIAFAKKLLSVKQGFNEINIKNNSGDANYQMTKSKYIKLSQRINAIDTESSQQNPVPFDEVNISFNRKGELSQNSANTMINQLNVASQKREEGGFNLYTSRQLNARWGGQVSILEKRPKLDFDRPAIWPGASKKGYFGCFIPGQSYMRSDNLRAIDRIFANQNIQPNLGSDAHIMATSTNLSSIARKKLENKHQIAITPVKLNGKEIAYIFSNQHQYSNTFFLSAHAGGDNVGTFTKPDGIEFNFVAPSNHLLQSNTMLFAEKYKKNEVLFKEDSQIYASPHREATNYSLNGNIHTQPEQVANFIGKMNPEVGGQRFDFVLLNREARGVHFTDLIQGLKDTLDWMPERLICHFCRRQNKNVKIFPASNNYTDRSDSE